MKRARAGQFRAERLEGVEPRSRFGVNFGFSRIGRLISSGILAVAALIPGLCQGVEQLAASAPSAIFSQLAAPLPKTLGGDPTQLPIPNFNVTQGRKTLLYIRVRYPDDPTEPVTEDQAYSMMNDVDRFYVTNSYGLITFITTVTPLVTLPQPKVYYGVKSLQVSVASLQVMIDARAAARAAGYDFAQYDFDVVQSVDLAGFTGGGLSTSGGRGIFTESGTGAASLARGLGFNLGLGYADSWDTVNRPKGPPGGGFPTDPDSLIGHDHINAPGKDVQEGDLFDMMGAFGFHKYHFNPIAKSILNWLPSQYIRAVRTSETNRLYAFDTPNLVAGRLYTLRIRKDLEREYWVDFRQLWTDNPWLSNGVELHWPRWSGFNPDIVEHSQLLDTTPGTPDGLNDGAVIVGRTFADEEASLYLTPIAKGGSNLQAWIDVVVQIGPFPTNVAPTVDLSADSLAVPVGGTVNFTAAAQDGNGDKLAYNWDFGDRTFGSNSPTNSKTFSAAGRYVVRCEVSDMKGGFGSAYVVVTVGAPTTLTVSGQIFDELGNPVQGVRVHNGVQGAGYRYALTDSEGNYTISDLSAGTYTVEAFRYGYYISPLDFFNPVQLSGGDAFGLDYIASAVPQVSIAATADAREDGTGDGQFIITRTGDTSQDLAVSFLVSGTASVDPGFENYVPLTNNGVIVIPAGSSSATLDITAINDGQGLGPTTVILTLQIPTSDIRVSTVVTNQGTNTVVLTLTNTVSYPGWELIRVGQQSTWFLTEPVYILGQAQATVSIIEADPPQPPFVSIRTVDNAALENGNDSATVLFSRIGSIGSDLVINYAVSGTASNGVDYVKLPGTITIPAGAASVALPIVAIDDHLVEGNETVTLTIINDDTYITGFDTTATVFIIDDDLPLVTLAPTDSLASEAGPNRGVLTVTRYGDLSGSLLVNYLVTGTASNGVDFVPLPGSITIPAGEITADINVNPIADSIPEAVETVTVVLSASSTYNIATPSTATVFIRDSLTPIVTLAVTTATAAEPSTAGLFTITRTGATTNSLLVSFVVGGTAVPQFDYASIGTNVTIPAGSSTATVTISPVDDAYREGAETVIVQLTASLAYTLGNVIQGTVTINDNDPNNLPAVGFLLPSSTVAETAGFAQVLVGISANPPTNRAPVVVEYHITGGSAANGADYSLSSTGYVTFTHDGPAFASINFPILNDGLTEGNETIFLTLFDPNIITTNQIVSTNGTTNFVFVATPTNAFLGAHRTHILTISDDDLSVVTITATNGLAYETGQQPSAFLITRTGSTAAPLTVNFAVTGTASSRSDYIPLGTSVTIPAGTNSVLLPLIPVDDPTEEFAESVIVTLISATGAHIGSPDSATVIIVDNDGTIQFTASTYSVNENEGPALINVQRTGNTNVAVSVDYIVSNGTASNALDFIASTGRITFAIGETLQSIPIQIIDDSLVEPVETVNLALANPTGGLPLGGQSTATLFIIDNDTGFQFATNNFRVNENDTNAVIVINRFGLTNSDATVTFWTTDGTARDGVDYRGFVGTNLTFLAGQAKKIVLLPILDDALTEGNETVILHLTNSFSGGGASGGTNPTTLTIVDDECALRFSSATYITNEYAGFVTLTVQRVGGTVNPVSVDYQTIDVTANSTDPLNPDYLAQTGTVFFQGDQYLLATNGSGALEFHPGDTNQTIVIPIFDDVIGEGNETFNVQLANPVTLSTANFYATTTTLGSPTNAVVTILDNETPGSVDYEYNPGLGANDRVFAVALQSDLQVVFGGDFTTVDGFNFNRIARLQPNGFLDSSFNPGTGLDGTVYAIAVQPDGKLLVGGAFNSFNTTNRARIARLNANGSLDLSFNPGSGANGVVRAIAVQTDNKILIAGDFTQVNGVAHSHIARLNADGSLDTSFAPSANNSVNALAVQGDGKILAGGAFSSVNGIPRNAIARLNTSGSTDLNFDPGAGANGPVNSLALQSDGGIILGGAFTAFDGNSRSYLVRLTSSGPLDPSFAPGSGPNGTVNAVAVHSSGKILIGGAFTFYNGASRNRFARLKSNGTLDLAFNIGAGANAAVQAVAVQPDTAVILGGDFTQINGLSRNRIARVHGDEKAGIISVEFAASLFTAWETNSVATITVARTGNTNQGFTIGYATTDGSASNGLDYVGTTNFVTFAAGETNKTFTLNLLDDALVEGDETVNLLLTNGPPNVDLSGRISATLLILDDERFVAFTGTNYVVNEGATNARITLRRTGGLFGTASVTFTTSDGTAVAGLDYSNATTTVTFADGESNKTVLVRIIDDFLGEVAETVLMSLSNPVGVTLDTRSSAVLTIIDNDLVYGTFSYNNTNRINILDAGPSLPYPSTIIVSNLTGVVSRVTVGLLGLTHTFPADVGVLLVSPSGKGVVLMADAGAGVDVFGANLQFDDLATGLLPQAGPIVSGTNRPTDYPPANTFASPAPSGPYGSALAYFNGSNPNGAWSLYVMDNRGSDAGVISNGWRLAMTTIDPATTNDLAMAMTDSPDPISAGTILTYSLFITNFGPIPATSVVVQDNLPASMSLSFLKFSQGSCSNLGNLITCNLGDLAAGDIASVVIKAVPQSAGIYTNTANITANEPDLAPGNNLAAAGTTVTPAVVADLSVSMTDSPDPVLGGQLLTYTVNVTNSGPLVATGVMLTNNLPAGVNFFSASVTRGSYVVAGSTLVFSMGSLEVGGGATASITILPRNPGMITNTANAVANEPDTSPDNRATAITQVTPAADLVVSLVDATDPVLTNGLITYTATVVNNGPVVAHGVSLFDTLPVQLTFVSATNSQGSNFVASGTVVFALGTIASGASATATIVVRAPPTPGVVANQVSVIGAEGDPNTANNSAIESTTISSLTLSGAGIIQNGVIEMGVNPSGDLNVPGTVPSSGKGVNTTFVGLRYIPTGAESTADGCLCEGWGVADSIGHIAGGANESADGGAFGLVIESFDTDGTTAKSVVRVKGTNEFLSVFRVTHYYHPSVTPNLYQVDVTIDNISSKDVHVLYRRVMDWDIEPTAFSEYSTMNKGTSTNLYYTSDNGFASANPLSGPSKILVTGNFVDSGPADHGALFDFDFGTVSPGGTVFFRTYYGAAGTEDDANKAVARVGAEAYSYGQPSTPKGPSRGEPNTFIFAFGGIGGSLLFGADTAVGMTANPSPVALGDALTYTISVTNNGPDPATGVILTDTLPPGVSVISATSTQGSVSNATGVITANLGGMTKGAVATITIRIVANAEAFLTNDVSVVANEVDGNVANNLASTVTAALALGTFANPAVITIADAAPAIPYPSIVHVTGLNGVVSKVTATLVDLTHSFPADIDALLVGPGGQSVVLMSDAGQGDDLNKVTLKFDDDAPDSLPASSAILPGSYKPTNIGAGDPFNSPAPPGPYGTSLSVFNGTAPNGDWLLYIMDDQGSDAGAVFGGWRLTFTTGEAAPPLRIDLSGNTIVLSWPASAAGYNLESQDVLSPSGAWNPFGGPPSVAGGRNTVTASVGGGGGKFFRLRK